MRFRFHSPEFDSEPVVSIDGVCPTGPNFSHWPGNRTPTDLKRDLSTGIALAVAERVVADPRERERLFSGIEIVSNNHIDTDGILSAFAFLDPRRALLHRDVLIAAATTGDFQVFTTRAGLAIELTLTDLVDPSHPSAHEWRELPEREKRQRQYELALDLLPRLLEHPFACLDRVGRDFERIVADVELARTSAVRVTRDDELAFAVVEPPRDIDRVAINTAAGDAVRVLTITADGDGRRYRYHDRIESWFDIVSRVVPARVPLSSLAARLDGLESSADGSHWLHHSELEPVPECWFGSAGGGPRFGPTVSGTLARSRLEPRVVTTAVRHHLEDGHSPLLSNRRCP